MLRDSSGGSRQGSVGRPVRGGCSCVCGEVCVGPGSTQEESRAPRKDTRPQPRRGQDRRAWPPGGLPAPPAGPPRAPSAFPLPGLSSSEELRVLLTGPSCGGRSRNFPGERPRGFQQLPRGNHERCSLPFLPLGPQARDPGLQAHSLGRPHGAPRVTPSPLWASVSPLARIP